MPTSLQAMVLLEVATTEAVLAAVLAISSVLAPTATITSTGEQAELQQCEGTTDRVSKFSSTKTPYSFVANPSVSGFVPAGCVPRQLWLLSRHGTRYPSRAGLLAIRDRLPAAAAEIRAAVEAGEATICPETVSLLESWSPDVDPEDEKRLHAEGEAEMTLMAERFQERFPALLSEDYHPEMFTFRSTKSQRARRSQLYFATGLFGRDVATADVSYEEPVRPHDPLIRFYKVCGRWQKEVKQNPNSLREMRLFEESELFRKNLLEPLSARLGRPDVIDVDELDALYNGCVFGQAWRPSAPSPWCQVFTRAELDLLEYREDLQYYWVDGYGHELSPRQACVLGRNLLENFENVTASDGDEESGVFYFSHSGAILKFLSYLGLFEDAEAPRHDNYDRMSSRRWRTSLFNSFAANVAFVLHECDGDGDFRVGLMVNERLTAIPGCPDEWCKFADFAALFEASRDCVLEEVCALDGGTTQEELASLLESAAVDDKY